MILLTVLVCSYNRKADLLELLESVLTQNTHGDFTFELLVVDNNSSDQTSEAVQARYGSDARVRLLVEKRQGKSFALNTGVKEAKGDLTWVVDSDQLLPPEYLHTMVRVFLDHPEVSMAGGKVVPLWPADPPSWLTRDHWKAIAMADYGEKPFFVRAENFICLLATCFRTEVLRNSGGYRLGLSVSGGQIGGVEDAELIQRLLNQGLIAYYEPKLELLHKVEPVRLTRDYHRRWYRGHGRFAALAYDEPFEQARFKLLGIPSHVYKDLVLRSVKWSKQRMLAPDQAFVHELKIRFLLSYISQRLRSTFAGESAESEAAAVGAKAT